jgi:hypothetical protein
MAKCMSLLPLNVALAYALTADLLHVGVDADSATVVA